MRDETKYHKTGFVSPLFLFVIPLLSLIRLIRVSYIFKKYIGLKQKFILFFNWWHLNLFHTWQKNTIYFLKGNISVHLPIWSLCLVHFYCFYFKSENGGKGDAFSSFDALLFLRREKMYNSKKAYVLFMETVPYLKGWMVHSWFTWFRSENLDVKNWTLWQS